MHKIHIKNIYMLSEAIVHSNFPYFKVNLFIWKIKVNLFIWKISSEIKYLKKTLPYQIVKLIFRSLVYASLVLFSYIFESFISPIDRKWY